MFAVPKLQHATHPATLRELPSVPNHATPFFSFFQPRPGCGIRISFARANPLQCDGEPSEVCPRLVTFHRFGKAEMCIGLAWVCRNWKNNGRGCRGPHASRCPKKVRPLGPHGSGCQGVGPPCRARCIDHPQAHLPPQAQSRGRHGLRIDAQSENRHALHCGRSLHDW